MCPQIRAAVHHKIPRVPLSKCSKGKEGSEAQKSRGHFPGRKGWPSPNLRSHSFSTPGKGVGRLPWPPEFLPAGKAATQVSPHPVLLCPGRLLQPSLLQSSFCQLTWFPSRGAGGAGESGVLIAHPGAPPPRNRSNRGSPGTSAPASPGGLGQTGPFSHHPGPPQVRVRGARSAARCRRH